MNRRALLVALIVGIMGAVLLVIYQRRFELEASGGEKVKLLVALKRIERGKPVTDDAVTVREVPLAYVDDRSIREADKPKIVGLRLGTTVKEQQLLMWTDIATGSEERKDLSSLVLPGYRAVAVRVSRDSSAGLIRPGDYVDVIGVLSPAGAKDNNENAKSASVLLQRVLVLALGNETSPEAIDQKKSGINETLLTLSLTLPEAQMLALSAERGRLSVVVRHPDDQQKTAVTDVSIETLSDPKRRAEIRGVRSNSGGSALPVNLGGGQ